VVRGERPPKGWRSSIRFWSKLIGRRTIMCIGALAVIWNLLGQQRVRFDPHSGLAAHIAPRPKSANCDIAEPNNNVAQFGTARPCAAPSIRPIFSEGARLEICRDYDIIFVVVVTAGRI
jgi:hypothetical protein